DTALALEAVAPTHAVRMVLAQSHDNIGYLLLRNGKRAEALTMYEKARDIKEKLIKANPNHIDFQSDLAYSHDRIGEVLWQTGKQPEALAAWQDAGALRQKLADANPTRTNYQLDVVHSYTNLGLVLLHLGRR